MQKLISSIGLMIRCTRRETDYNSHISITYFKIHIRIKNLHLYIGFVTVDCTLQLMRVSPCSIELFVVNLCNFTVQKFYCLTPYIWLLFEKKSFVLNFFSSKIGFFFIFNQFVIKWCSVSKSFTCVYLLNKSVWIWFA